MDKSNGNMVSWTWYVWGKYMKKIWTNTGGFRRMGILVTAIIVITGTAGFFALRRGQEETIKIGVILPLTGVGEPLGVEAGEGMLLAADEINSRNGIHGRKIELILEDSKTDPQEGKTAFTRVEQRDRPLFYVSALSAVSEAIAPLAEENSVVLFGLMTASTGFTEKRQWVFRYYVTAEIEAQPLLSILQALHVKHLGIIYIHDEYGMSVLEIVKQGFQARGGIVRSKAFNTGEFTYTEQIEALKEMEAICFIGLLPHTQEAFKQFREMNFKGFILAAGGVSNPLVTSMPEANGAYLSAPIIYDPHYLFAKEAKERYEARYKKPFNLAAATGYDFLIFIAGLLQDKKIFRENVKIVLEEGFMYPGVFGVLDVQSGEHDIRFPFHPAQIVDGELKYLHIHM
jgi:branched-chain amino acid transport system substrate-binding protein